MTIRFIEGEYLVVADHFTKTKPHKWLREEVLWHQTGVTLADAHAAADRFRATYETPYRRVGMYQAHTGEQTGGGNG
ncbi:hypothetical protein [Microbispora rosea]|uniref:hypothetical protein n=1 Tax=Microbispora rosea TaxID=58117 RepID=UPI0004C44874|nr:hypothetical protein [Microbispora rosea]